MFQLVSGEDFPRATSKHRQLRESNVGEVCTPGERCCQEEISLLAKRERNGSVTEELKNGSKELPLTSSPLSCFYRAAGIYSDFALKRVARRGGRKPTFLLGR